MDTSTLKKFASFARTSLIEQVGTRLKSVLADQSLARRENAATVTELEKKIKELGKDRVIDMVAYTWFNRFCALRFMDVNQYTTIGTVSPAEGFTQPEILTEAKQGVIDEELKVDRARILGLLDGTRPSQDAQGEVYQQLLIAVCNSYHKLMPFMFEKIADYTELLIPEDLLSDSSVLSETRKALTVENCADVEVIGWLYQFYISEKKDDVFAALKKGKKITPENIPAATQLFTPHWIVRYLVENSLGRLWMLNHPVSKLVERMDYYVKPEEPETDFLKVNSPEDIKVCDPACGSGHMLTYAFDLLYAIYEEQGYQATDIPRLILKHNLYGVEIDQRAGALAAFALVMKALQKDRRFFSRMPLDEDSSTAIQNPNVCVLENIQIDPDDLSAYMDKVGRDLFSCGLQGVVNQWNEANNYGSLIRPIVTDVGDVLKLLRERQMGQDLFLADVHQKVLRALRQADYLSPKYHIVVANPPYMGQKGMNKLVKKFVEKHYASAKTDLMTCFMERAGSLCHIDGYWGMINLPSWLFLSSFDDLRHELVSGQRINSLLHLGRGIFGSDFGSVAFTFQRRPPRETEIGYYRRLFDQHVDVRTVDTIESLFLTKTYGHYTFRQADLLHIPGCPIAYHATEHVLSLFRREPSNSSVSEKRLGLCTGDNERFLRYWHEVAWEGIGIGCSSYSEFSSHSQNRYAPHNKGGAFRRWTGNKDYIIKFDARSYEALSGLCNRLASKSHYFRPSLTWTEISSAIFSMRALSSGYTFNIKGPSVFCKEERRPVLLAYFNSKPFSYLLGFLNQTVSFNGGDVERVPYCELTAAARNTISANTNRALEISMEDLDSSELSWDFQKSPLLRIGEEQQLSLRYDLFRERMRRMTRELHSIETGNNELFIAEYGLSDELTPDVPTEEISLNANPVYRFGERKSDSELDALLLADTMREFISYAVGCMFGRYSLDKPGLILANQGETADDYRQQIPAPTFAPDEDNVIPLLDGDWFEDDITERFKAFLKVTFGTEHYEANLKFLEDALHPDNLTGKKRKTIRDYFLKDFYNHHIKLYKKRPIYWLFSSSKGTFNALIYMHRYRPDTVGTVLHYLRDFRDKLTHHAEHQQMLADSASASKSEKTQAIKDVAAIKKQLKELEDYEKTLFEVAARKIDIDLDDGVKHNYQLFGSVLRKIPGLDAKDD